VEPRLDRRVGSPGGPALVGPLESVLSAILGSGTIAEKRDECAEDPAVRIPVEPLEIGVRPRLVAFRRNYVLA